MIKTKLNFNDFYQSNNNILYWSRDMKLTTTCLNVIWNLLKESDNNSTELKNNEKLELFIQLLIKRHIIYGLIRMEILNKSMSLKKI